MSSIDTIYNRYGEPVLRLFENGRLVTFTGESVGFLDNLNLYNYNGEHVGWFEGGIVRDHSGAVVGFSEKVTDYGHPYLPYKLYKPYALSPEYEPYRPYKQYAPYKPFKSMSWSELDPISLFNSL